MELKSESTISNKIYSIPILGDAGVGKTAIINRYVNDEFSSTCLPLNNNIVVKKGKKSILQLIDEADGSSHAHLKSKYHYNNASAWIIAFDLTDETSFNRIEEYWMKYLIQHRVNVPIILVGTKNDLPNQIENIEEKAIKLAEHLYNKYRNIHINYFGSTSALKNEKIDELFKYTKLKIRTRKYLLTKEDLEKNQLPADTNQTIMKKKSNTHAVKRGSSPHPIYSDPNSSQQYHHLLVSAPVENNDLIGKLKNLRTEICRQLNMPSKEMEEMPLHISFAAPFAATGSEMKTLKQSLSKLDIASIKVKLGTIKAFPGGHTLYLSIIDDSEVLNELNARITKIINDTGIPCKAHSKYIPHITLCFGILEEVTPNELNNLNAISSIKNLKKKSIELPNITLSEMITSKDATSYKNAITVTTNENEGKERGCVLM